MLKSSEKSILQIYYIKYYHEINKVYISGTIIAPSSNYTVYGYDIYTP